MTLWSWFWLMVGLLVVVVDVVAARNRTTGDTLTEHIRWLMGRSRITRVVVIGLLAWLVAHLLGPPGWV